MKTVKLHDVMSTVGVTGAVYCVAGALWLGFGREVAYTAAYVALMLLWLPAKAALKALLEEVRWRRWE